MCMCEHVCLCVQLFQCILTHYKLYKFPLVFFTLTNSTYLSLYVCYYLKGIMTMTGSATYSKDTALAHMLSSMGWPLVFAALYCHLPVSLY